MVADVFTFGRVRLRSHTSPPKVARGWGPMPNPSLEFLYTFQCLASQDQGPQLGIPVRFSGGPTRGQ